MVETRPGKRLDHQAGAGEWCSRARCGIQNSDGSGKSSGLRLERILKMDTKTAAERLVDQIPVDAETILIRQRDRNHLDIEQHLLRHQAVFALQILCDARQ